MSRPSPSESATLFPLGHREKGNDGNIWIIVENKNRVKRWQKIASSEPRTKDTVRPHTILFCEPRTLPSYKDNFWKSQTFQVSHQFATTTLRRKPVYKQSRFGNAFLFGPQFALTEYKHILSHGNDVAQTGLIDITNLGVEEKRNLLEAIENDPWERLWDYENTWENVLTARKLISPRMVFFGDTFGGDVGADLYAHYNLHHEMDSLIIENNYYFVAE